jgi:hypothetical protein
MRFSIRPLQVKRFQGIGLSAPRQSSLAGSCFGRSDDIVLTFRSSDKPLRCDAEPVAALWTDGRRRSAVHQSTAEALGKLWICRRRVSRGSSFMPRPGMRDWCAAAAASPGRAAQVVAPLPGGWRGRTGVAQPPPARLATQKVFADQETLILSLRRERRLGVKQLRNELIRQHDLMLSIDTIDRTLVWHGEQVLKRPRRWRKGERRYSRAPAANTLDCLERLIEEMRLPIQRIQTDRGREFFAEAVQQRLMDWAIKFRPILPRSPHLNGKVERTHRADREDFWDTVDVEDPEIEAKLAEWQHHWNRHRPHTALDGQSPIDRVCELLDKTPLGEAVEASYEIGKERIRVADCQLDLALAQLK